LPVGIPSFAEFEQAAARGNLLALSTTINFDQETAITLADRFVAEEDFFLLESATAGPGGIARYSFIGFDPLCSFVAEAGTMRLQFAGMAPSHDFGADQNPVAALATVLKRFTLAVVGADRQLVDGVDVCGYGGVFGFFGYDVAVALEPSIGALPPHELEIPEAYFFVPRNFLVLDQLCRKLTLIRFAYLPDKTAATIKSAYELATQCLRALLEKVKTPHVLGELKIKDNGPIDFAACKHSVTQTEFFAKVDLCLEQIRAGEIYQIQIGNRLSCAVPARPFDVFRHLRILNPSPYMVFYRFGKHHIVCASPEMMVNVTQGHIEHRPIAGTRKRTWMPTVDAEMRAELQSDIKERAEHVMLVDLSRNDIGRIAAPGSVRVDELMSVEEYSHVFHLVSQVSGELRPGLTAFDAMAASFPNGTVSGAPKIRAMELINQLEPCSREFYAGSLGVFDWRGNLKSTILIRTLHIADGWGSTQASAGIVYDSVPKNEWQETRNKMAACLVAMQKTL